MSLTYHLGIDIGGTNIKYAKVYADGSLEDKNKVNTPLDLEGFLNQLDQIYTQFDSSAIEAVAISMPGKVDTDAGIVYFGGSLPFLHEFNFKEHFQKTYGKNCTIVNDAKAAALCELWLGNLQGVQNGIVITLGTGIGGGIILNGKLYQSTNFQAGEFSFLTNNVFDLNRKNIVGYTLSSVHFIEECGRMLGWSGPVDGERVFEEINKRENPHLIAFFRQYVREVVNMFVNIHVLLDLEKVLIGGGISEQAILMEEIDKQYEILREESEFYGRLFERVTIDTCAFKNNSNILGAVFASIGQLGEEE